MSLHSSAIRGIRRLPRRVATKVLRELKRFYRYHISRSFFTFTVERTASINGPIGVAIVALYPRGPLIDSVNRLLGTLVDGNYLVIAVVNQGPRSNEWLAELGKLNITLISRPNIGRDFGAYKIGYIFAAQRGLLEHAQHLVIANDSVFYGPRSEKFLSDLLNEEHPWVSMFVNHQIHTHAQSFFIRVNREIFTRTPFAKFWHGYYPSDERKHTINKGEVRLSATISELGYVPYAHVSADRILSSKAFGEFTENEKHNIRRPVFGRAMIPLSLEHQQIEELMRAGYRASNVTHTQGTLASRVLGAPLKLDLDPLRVTQEALRDTLLALGCSSEETLSVLNFMLNQHGKHVQVTKPSLHKLMKVLHRDLNPRTYLEVGVDRGGSLALASCPAIGIDPVPAVTQRLPATTQLVHSTSDAFFANPHPLERLFPRGDTSVSALNRVPQLLSRRPEGAPRRSDGEIVAELSLIDGMHHADFALRDFINIERHSAPWSVIVFDDMLPVDHKQAQRTRTTIGWTGDVFRLEKILQTYRPDLVTVRIDTASGALMVFAPNHHDQRLSSAYDQIMAQFVQSDPQVVPDDVLTRIGAFSISELHQRGVLKIVRRARQRKASAEWVAQELRAALA
jgi:hypothetical protein